MANFGQQVGNLNYQVGDMEQSLSGRVIPRPDGIEVVEVLLNFDGMIDFVNAYFDRMDANFAATGGGATLMITREEFTAYVKTLVSSRIRHATKGVMADFNRPIVEHHDNFILVPPFLAEALENIGRVRLESLGIEFIPVDPFSGVDLLDKVEMHRISRQLEVLQRVGFVFATGYRRDQNGDPDFMALQCIDGVVRSHTDSATPLKAALAYFLGMVQNQVLLGTRIRYCDYSEARSMIWDLAARH